MADDHYVIEKSAMEQRTITEIYHLSDDASVGEIARLLGGVEITDAVSHTRYFLIRSTPPNTFL